jgi:hypothetical protein
MFSLQHTIHRIGKTVACALVLGALVAPAALASPVLTENSNFKQSHAADPQTAVPLSENSYFSWSHSSDPQSTPPLSENSYYSWSHSSDPQSTPPLSENSYYNWSHADDPGVGSVLASTGSSPQTARPTVVQAQGGFDFVDAGIGAVSVLGIALLGSGSVLVVRSRRKAIAI